MRTVLTVTREILCVTYITGENISNYMRSSLKHQRTIKDTCTCIYEVLLMTLSIIVNIVDAFGGNLKKVEYIHIRICPEAEVVIALCDRIMHSVILTYSRTSISSARQVRPSIRTHLPTLHFQEIMLLSMKAPVPTEQLPTKVQFFSREPLRTVQLGPITTFGPILQPYSTVELSSISTFPIYYPFDLGLFILWYSRNAPWPMR